MDPIDVRMSQLIYTWGVGSVVPLPNGASGIVAGLDKWDNSDPNFAIADERLAKRLHLKGFRMPPYFSEKGRGRNDSKKRIPIFAFPTWYYCPVCHCVHDFKQGSNNLPPECPECKRRNPKSHVTMVPERFIVVCPDGHIDDLPILRLLHGPDFDEEEWKKEIGPLYENHQIKRYSSNKTSSIAGITYECKCGKKFSMAEVIGKNKAKLIEAYGGKCPGTRPWLGDNKENCTRDASELKVIQRGGTNVWYPLTISSIFLPKSGDPCMAAVQQNIDALTAAFSTLDEDSQRKIIPSLMRNYDFSFEEIRDKYHELTEDDTSTDVSEAEYRFEEYKCLQKNYGKDTEDLYVAQSSLNDFTALIQKYFSKIGRVKRLKETRALVGFSRLEPNNFETIALARKQLSVNNVDWVPAVQATGEGIFLEFNKDTIDSWKNNAEVIRRESVLEQNYQNCKYHSKDIEHITSTYLLIHTFAHIFINELSKECGYGSSSLRERLYVSEDEKTPMHGVLIYTSSGDSEGSLGGLVRQAEKDNFQYILENAIREAAWCSADPVCINSQGQGPDSCNLAACFSCALLPETCCETGNRFLDRGMLVGNPSRQMGFGFFDDLLKESK